MRERMLMILAVILFAAALLWPIAQAFALTNEETALLEAADSGEIIRLHVVANSNSPRDQFIKLAVRNAITDAFAFEGSCDEIYAALLLQADAMESIARKQARACGFMGEVRAEVGVMHLPAKTYGQVTLPAGEYRALRITLGKGLGRNWWCVLFPQLCLAVSQDGPGVVRWNLPDVFKNWTLLPISVQSVL